MGLCSFHVLISRCPHWRRFHRKPSFYFPGTETKQGTNGRKCSDLEWGVAAGTKIENEMPKKQKWPLTTHVWLRWASALDQQGCPNGCLLFYVL